MIELYQFEGCSYCEKVRKKLDELGKDYIIRTVDSLDRSRVKKVSGQESVPVLVDDEETLNESDDIIEYLEENYG